MIYDSKRFAIQQLMQAVQTLTVLGDGTTAKHLADLAVSARALVRSDDLDSATGLAVAACLNAVSHAITERERALQTRVNAICQTAGVCPACLETVCDDDCPSKQPARDMETQARQIASQKGFVVESVANGQIDWRYGYAKSDSHCSATLAQFIADFADRPADEYPSAEWVAEFEQRH